MIHFKEVQDALNCEFIILHHTTKDKTQSARGTTAIIGGADHELYVRTRGKPPKVTVTTRKSNHSERLLNVVGIPV